MKNKIEALSYVFTCGYKSGHDKKKKHALKAALSDAIKGGLTILKATQPKDAADGSPGVTLQEGVYRMEHIDAETVRLTRRS